MFSQNLFQRAPPIVRSAAQSLANPTEIQARNVATLKTLSLRMRSIKNMQKITKAMKMVAAAKMRKDERAMQLGLPFAQPAVSLFQRLGQSEGAGSLTILPITSDKGLCGGVNSAVNKQVRLLTNEEEAKGNTVKLAIMGGKGVAGLKRLYGDRFTMSFEDLAKAPWSFGAASIIADKVLASNPGRMKLISNQFKSMVAYETEATDVITLSQATAMDRAEWSKAMDVYSFEPSIYEVFNDLQEFYTGCVIFGAQLQSSITETSQRMSAMENASKNAGEMYEKVSLQFNRARQAKITTELCEIISGASAV
jgi:F-type H+-transporting ATPase subunit gamma|mmetsp:Transcript_97436/g.154180  ORF Transcript_97436/g.154180 Transcript_97436/m.154180 type:complete len:309 (+) Transcript_97436:53-979(+)